MVRQWLILNALGVCVVLGACAVSDESTTDWDVTTTPQQAVDSPTDGMMWTNAKAPSVAFDGTNYLVVWQDQRDVTTSSDFDIWGTRVAQNGTILDAHGIRIGGGTGAQQRPVVAYDGTRFVVAWENYKVLGGSEADIAVALVSSGGAVSAASPVATTSASETAPALAGNGAGLLLTWVANGQIVGAVASAGSFGPTFGIATNANAHREPAVAASPSGNYLVAFTETVAGDDNVRGQLVTPAGSLAGGAFDICAGIAAQSVPAVAFDGTNFGVVWTNANAIYGARVSTAGTVLDTHLEGAVTVGGVSVSTTSSVMNQPSIACLASGCFVTWEDRRNVYTAGYDIYSQALSTTFGLVGGEVAVSGAPRYQLLARVVANGAGYFAVWQDERTGTYTIGASRIAAPATVVDAGGIQVVPGWTQELTPALTRVGTTWFVGWSDSRNGWGSDLAASRLDLTGALLDTTPRSVSAGAFNQNTPTAAGLGANALFAWSDARTGIDLDIYAARMSGAGVLVDTSGIAVSTAAGDQISPSVAASSSEALVVWQDGGNRQTTGYDILGAFVSASGVAGAPFVICNDAAEQMSPAVAYDDTTGQYVVVWIDTRLGASARDLYGARVSTGGVLDVGGVPIGTGLGIRLHPQIASSSGVLLVAYEDQRNPSRDIYATRLTTGATLSVLDASGIAIATEGSKQVLPTVAATTSGFLVAWTDPRSFATTQDDIWAQRITRTGGLVGGNFVVSAGPEEESLPAAVGSGGTKVLVSYQQHRDDLNTTRVVTRVVDTTATLLSIAVAPANASIPKGTTQGYSATATYDDGTTADVTASATWASSSTAVATISSAAVATAQGIGTTTISATIGGVVGSTALTVTAPVLVSIDVTPLDDSIASGTTLQLTATGIYSDASTADLTVSALWTSSDGSVASVVGGLATGATPGITTVTATSGTIAGATTLTVTSAVLTELTITPEAPTIAKGTYLQFTATGTYSDGTSQDLTTQVAWASSAAAVAPIGSTGLAFGLATGMSNVSASLGAISDSTVLTVSSASLLSIAVTPASATIAKGTTQQFTAIGTFSDLTTQDVTAQASWSSSSSTVATVTGGLATGAGVGSASIRATLSGKVGAATLNVTAATLISIIVTPANKHVAKGWKLQFTATGQFSDSSTQDLTTQATWSSTSTAVATISNAAASKGLANVKAVGTTTIRATFGGKTGSTTLVGTNATLSSIAVTPSVNVLAKGATKQLVATGTFNDGTTLDITTQVSWRSSAKKKVSVKKGLVTAVKSGSATITARASGKTGTATVIVP